MSSFLFIILFVQEIIYTLTQMIIFVMRGVLWFNNMGIQPQKNAVNVIKVAEADV